MIKELPATSSKFTPERRAVILAALTKGASIRVAAEYARISRHTLYDWIRRGEAGEEPYVDFAEDVAQAQSQNALDMLEVLEKSAKEGGDVKSAMWLLERRHGYTPDQRVQVTGQDGGPVQIEHSGEIVTSSEAATMTGEQLATVLDRLAALRAELDSEAEPDAV